VLGRTRDYDTVVPDDNDDDDNDDDDDTTEYNELGSIELYIQVLHYHYYHHYHPHQQRALIKSSSNSSFRAVGEVVTRRLVTRPLFSRDLFAV
jgi:hypothetical protein